MYKLFGFQTQNTKKTLYVLESIDCDYEFQYVDLFKRENREADFLKFSPFGKTPVLKHQNDYLFESGAICRYLANIEESVLYPQDKFKRAQVDQWMDFFSCHLGKWLSNLYFEKMIKPAAGIGQPDAAKCQESETFAKEQLEILEKWFGSRTYFLGNEMTIADLFAFAYIEQMADCKMPLEAFAKLQSWFERIESLESIHRARLKVQEAVNKAATT